MTTPEQLQRQADEMTKSVFREMIGFSCVNPDCASCEAEAKNISKQLSLPQMLAVIEAARNVRRENWHHPDCDCCKCTLHKSVIAFDAAIAERKK